jgi:hypothetical protein
MVVPFIAGCIDATRQNNLEGSARPCKAASAHDIDIIYQQHVRLPDSQIFGQFRFLGKSTKTIKFVVPTENGRPVFQSPET